MALTEVTNARRSRACRAQSPLDRRIAALSRKQDAKCLADERRLRDAAPTGGPPERDGLILRQLHDRTYHPDTNDIG